MPVRTQRHDRAGYLGAKSRGGSLSGKGALRGGVAARLHNPGDPLRYPWGVEYRDAESLKAIAEQLPGKPLVSPHPNGMIARGAAAHIIGTVKSARVDGGRIRVECEVTPDGQHIIDGGNDELSVGYDATVDGDRFQREIVVDHLAAVPNGRCGPECRLDHGGSMKPMKRTDEYLPGTMPTNLPVDGIGEGCDCGCAAASTTETDPRDTDALERIRTGNVPSATLSMSNSMANHADKKLNAADRNAISVKHFAVPSREALPIEDEGHVKAAMARFNQEKFQGPAERKSAFHLIVARAHELGIDPKGFVKKFGDHLDDGMESESMDRKDAGKEPFDNDDDVPSGGGEAGRAQTGPNPGFAAPDIAAKLATALDGMKELQAKYDALKGQYDAITMAKQVEDEEACDEDDLEAGVEKARADKAEGERDALKSERDAAVKAAAHATKRADAADVALKAASDKSRFDADGEFNRRVDARVAERADLLAKATNVLGVADRNTMSDRDVMCAVVKHIEEFEMPGDKSADYVRARFDAAMTRATHVTQSFANVRQTLHQNRMDGSEAASALKSEKAAQAEMVNRSASAWAAKNKK